MKIHKLGLLSLFLYPAFNASAQSKVPRPKLVVGIVADQMRWDYLYRYYDRYGSGGLKKLMAEGYNCQNTMISYLPSFTAPGHTGIYTGSVPALHGIAGNDWIDNRTGKEWYCTEDTTVKSVGGGAAGLMSPANMLASTITDELRLATNFRAKTIGISLKDRGAILPAGHMATAAYWYDNETGNFITSTYYMQALPEWVTQFNSRSLNDSLMQTDWNTLYPINTYHQSIADNNPYEGKAKGESAPVFPHRTSAMMKDKGAIRSTPFGNTLTRMMAEACINAEQLGMDEETDFLALSFSSTDYIGHQYAPNSIEVEDTYLRFDKEIEQLLNFLDKKIGKDNYVIFLTADHGGAHNASFLSDNGLPAKAVTINLVNAELNRFLAKEFGDTAIVRSLMNYQVFLDENIIAAHHLDRSRIRHEIMQWFRTQQGVTYVIDMEDIGQNPLPSLLKDMTVNGYYAHRSGSIQIILDPAWYSGHATTGTTHGSWNPYDTHIPLLWYGWHIRKGATFKTTYMTDIAATLAALLHIQAPNASIGTVINEIVQ